MRRYLHAFLRALWMTLRGQKHSAARFQPLEIWMEAGLHKVEQVIRAADEAQIPPAARTQIQLKLDGRPTSLEQTLQMVQHNLRREYPRLLRVDDPLAMAVVQSSNLNDHYRVSQFVQRAEIASPALKQALAALEAHLSRLPQIQEAEAD